MKRHPLGLMIAIVLLQTACTTQNKSFQQEHIYSPHQVANVIAPKPVFEPEILSDKKDNPTIVNAGEEKENYDELSASASRHFDASFAKSRMQAAKSISNQAKTRQAPMAMGQVMAYAPAPAPTMDAYAMSREERDQFAHFNDNPIKQATNDPVSTFSLDVDTGSYALVRQFLQQGRLPASDAVRTEELINYFSYSYPKNKGQTPFSTDTELSTAPWQSEHYLLRIGVQAQDIQSAAMPPANLVFLVDVSGSMDEPNKLPLVISSLQMLTQQLRPRDKVSLVVYAGRTEVVLEPTAGNHKADIQAALARLQAGGSTAGASALSLAYKMARKGYINNGINRILMATDGDFNVGVTDTNQLKDMVKRERETGITLSTLGFGQGNFND
ncbi:MAG: von Willebrand factor type A domain-containing protein [Candidatus Saccharibacteria bacterium]|nr:von Willebrand factor type A domain-containing protein [Moraxellaceae bacterium]